MKPSSLRIASQGHFEAYNGLAPTPDALPVGMMLAAKPFDEETIDRAAAAFENAID